MAARRRFPERLLLVVNVTVANGLAALWIATFLQPAVLGGSLGAVPGQERVLVMPLHTAAAWIAFLSAVGLLLWNFAALVRRREGSAPSNWVISETAGGPVRVAREAIEAGLRIAGESLPEVTRLRVQLDATPKRLRVLGMFHCAEGRDHLAASQRLRKAMEQRFGELVRLGDGARAEFEIEFQGFSGKVAKNAVEPPSDPEADEEPFRGPQYPIDDDEGQR